MKIDQVEIYVLDIELTHQRRLSKGAVSAGEAGREAVRPVLVRVMSSEGAVGYGMVRPPTPWLGETTDSVVSAIKHFYGPLLVRSNIPERNSNMRALNAILPGNSVARAAIDMAIHDVLARSLGIPVYELLGGSRAPIPLDWSVSLNPRDVMVAEAVRAVRDYGLGVLCLKVGPSSGWKDDVAVVKAVRTEVGESVQIGLDPNEGYDVSTTVRVVEQLEGGVEYLEQPVDRRDTSGLRALRGHVPAKILADECSITLQDASSLIEQGACDGLVLKLWKSGGFTEALAMGVMANAAGLETTVGGVSHGCVIEAAACAHLYASVQPPPMAAEFVLGLNVLDCDPVTELPESFQPKDGSVLPPAGPGLGVAPDMNEVQARSVSRVTIRAGS